VTRLPICAASAAAFAGWLLLRRAIMLPLGDALAHFRQISEGDLTDPVRIRRKDEMGELLAGIAQMKEKLASTVSGVRAGTESIAIATRQIVSGNADLSARTEAQAASLQQTAASMEQLTATVKQNAENARQVSGLADAASDVAKQGSKIVGRVVATMDGIGESSSKIGDIVSIIDGRCFPPGSGAQPAHDRRGFPDRSERRRGNRLFSRLARPIAICALPHFSSTPIICDHG
jgi:methyl-accepting chemotaxis protein I, serine sensor receptor